MFKISRAYLANTGYRMAWYDGLLLDFRDPESSAPTSTIYNLVNQGGKTTFLSLLFSCIRTKKDDFLQTLGNPAQVFEDYFDKGGTPGVIAIEWSGVAADGVARSMVTGQIVVMSRQDGDAERWFFLVSDAAKLALEGLPGPNLNGKTLTDRAAVVQWLHETRSALGEQAFYYTQTQSEWAKALVQTGLDVELISRQVDFNKREGAMDDSFLSFKDEREFLRRFLVLTMNAENAERVYQAISVHSKNIASRKPSEAALGQLERLQGHLEPFGEAAVAVGACQAAHLEAEQALSAAVVTLTARAQSATLRQQESEAQVKVEAAIVGASESSKVAAAQSREVAVEEQLKRTHLEFDNQVTLASEALQGLHTRRKEIIAAGALRLQVDLKFQLTELTKALDALNGDIAPLRSAYASAAAQFSYALRVQRKDVVARMNTANTNAQKLKKDIADNTASRVVLGKRLDLANGDLAKAEAMLETGRQRRLQLETDGTLHAGETSDASLERWAQEMARALAARDKAEEAQQGVEARLAELTERDAHLRSEATKHIGALGRAKDRLKEAQAARAKLCAHPVLGLAIEADIVDPDSEVLPGLLERHQQNVQRELTQAELTVGRLDEDARSFRETGLSGQNLDVRQVVQFLAENGIKGARAYAEYISDVVPDAVAARLLVQSDPARFLGVVVPLAEQLARARSLEGYPPLSRPVVISVAATVPTRTGADSDLFVVGSRDASLFNRVAAAEFSRNVDTELQGKAALRDSLREAFEATLEAKTQLNKYLSEHGPVRVAALQDEITRTEALLAEVKVERASIDAEKVAQKARSVALKTELKDHSEAGRKADDALRKVQEFVQAHESRMETLAKASALALSQKEEISAQLETLADYAERDSAALRVAEREADAREADAATIATEMGSITGKDESWTPTDEGAQGIDSLRLAYKTALLALQAKEAGEAAGLHERKKAAVDGLEKAQTDYVAKADGLLRANIEALYDADLDAVDRAAAQAIPGAEKLKEQGIGNRAVAQSDLKQWRDKRQYPAHQEPELAEMSSPDLAGRIAELDLSIATAQAAMEGAQKRQNDAGNEAKAHYKAAQKFKDAGSTLRAFSAGEALVRDDMFLSADSALNEATALRETAEKAEKQLKTLVAKASKLFEQMQALAADPAFEQVDLDLALTLKRNTLSEALDDHERLGLAITQRMDSIRAELMSMDADFGRAMDSLLQLVDDSLALLRRATQGIKLPDNVPRVAGRSVLKISSKVFAATREERLEMLKPMVLTLAAENRLPTSGPALATHAIMNLAHDKLGLKLLKVVDDEQEQYVSVDRMSKSGAESITMAMLLYFVIAKLRSEEHTGRHANAGVLILDNPFSKATSRQVWEIIVGLADAMGLQLILATGMSEFGTLSVFKRFIRVAKLTRNSVSGRQHLGFADFSMKEPIADAFLQLGEAA